MLNLLPRRKLVEHILTDLITDECIPDCKRCLGKWRNESISHTIICECGICNHKVRREKNV